LTRNAALSSIKLVKVCVDSKDETAWTEFIRRFHHVIASAVLRTARVWDDESDAAVNDLIQDTYLKLCDDDFRMLRTFESRQENSIYGFLKVVAANVVHDHYKAIFAAKRGVQQTEPLTDAQADARPSQLDSFELASQRLQLDQIEKILLRVTAGKDQEKKRIVFWLRYRQGFSAREIASIPSIGLTPPGVESMLLRLIVMIRGHMLSSGPHREVKVLKRQNRSKRVGT